MSLDGDVGADKYGAPLVRAIEGIFGAYLNMPQTPDNCVVKKGDILKATPSLDADPFFKRSEIIIIGYDPQHDYVVGTSLRNTDKTFLFHGTWSVHQLENELVRQNFWEIQSNIGPGESALSDYFIQKNAPRN